MNRFLCQRLGLIRIDSSINKKIVGVEHLGSVVLLVQTARFALQETSKPETTDKYSHHSCIQRMFGLV
jgi:hypothetical protein